MKRLSSVVPGMFMIVVAIVAAVILYRVSAPQFPTGPSDRQTLLDYNRCLIVADAGGTLDSKALLKCGEQLAGSTTTDDLIKGRLDEMRWMLTMIGSLAAFFVIAQSASAFFTAQSYGRSADEAIARITEQEAAIRARYPVFAEVEKLREEAYGELRTEFKDIQDRGTNDPIEALAFLRRFYQRMPVQTRQRLLSVESFASIDLDQDRSDGEDYVADLIRLGFFYQSKFLHEDASSRGALSDLERAESYLRIAFEKSDNDFTILNDLGNLYLSFYKACGIRHPEDLLKKAEDEFLASLRQEPKQQRGHYNLGVVAGKYRQKYKDAVIHFRNATQQSNWERLPVRNTQGYIYYNLGCYLARDLCTADAPITTAQGKECLDALNIAASFHNIPQKMVEDDFGKSDGDIYPLHALADQFLKLELEKAKQALFEHAPPSNSQTIQEALRASWDLLRSAVSKRA